MKNNSGRRQNVFFCASPFTIMTALQLALTTEREAESDLYVIGLFSQAEQVADRIAKTGVFRNVIPVHNEIVEKLAAGIRNQPKSIRWIRLAGTYLRSNNIAKAVLKYNSEVPYDRMYVSSRSLFNRLIAMYYAKKGFNTEIVFFEDGLGCYYNKELLKPRVLDGIYMSFLTGKRTSVVEPKKLLLYKPDLLRRAGVISTNGVEVKDIPKWEQTQKFTDVMNKIFLYSDKDAIKEPIIIFDRPYTGERRQRMDSFYKKIVELAGVENVILKKHPRDKGKETEGIKYYRHFDLAFELLCLNTNMEGKLLIGPETTAIVTPKLLLDQEPGVLALSKIEGMAGGEALGVNFGDFREMYKDKDKFLVAESENNALDFVKKFCEQLARKSL